MENESTLESYGLKSGSMVHVLKKKESKDTATPSATASGSETNINKLTSVFKSFIGNPLRELALRVSISKEHQMIAYYITVLNINHKISSIAFDQET